MTPDLSHDDLAEIAARGMAREEVEAQLALLRDPPPAIRLERPCTLGDGVTRLPPASFDELESRWREAAAAGRLLKFVPASGAASRMFAALRKRPVDASDAVVAAVARGLPRLPFFERLRAFAAARGDDLEALLAAGAIEPVFDLVVEVLDLGERPKGLLEFHRYPAGARTAFEEHLRLGRRHLSAGGVPSRFHFTVAPERLTEFEELLAGLRAALERELGTPLAVDFSVQRPDSDAVALDGGGNLFRCADGRLLFRPAGHGALIENLRRLAGDLVYLQNVDNVPHERLQESVATWKRRLAGHLVSLQRRCFEHLERLERGSGDPGAVDEALGFLCASFALRPPPALETADLAARARYVGDRLGRPLRVCGVVPSAGDPGGGPFWVTDAEGAGAGQIVESAQVDRSAPTQVAAWRAATHFNSVDLVCGLRDRRGRPYDLRRFVDPAAVILSRKTHEGRPLVSLERPGLWNGAMAHWNTAFVEVPAETFNPVKTLRDLLHPAHQPEP